MASKKATSKAEFIALIDRIDETGQRYALLRALRAAFFAESKKLLSEVFGDDNLDLKDIEKKTKYVDDHLSKRELKEGFRDIKGLMEDVIAFIVLDEDPTFEVTTADRASTYRDHILDNYPRFFVEGNENVNEGFRLVITEVYNFAAKVDHKTSLQEHVVGIERQGSDSGLEKACDLFVPMLWLLIVGYCARKAPRHSDAIEFIMQIFGALWYITSLLVTYELAKSRKSLSIDASFTSRADKEYITKLQQLANDSREDIIELEATDPHFMREILGTVYEELVRRKYI